MICRKFKSHSKNFLLAFSKSITIQKVMYAITYVV